MPMGDWVRPVHNNRKLIFSVLHLIMFDHYVSMLWRLASVPGRDHSSLLDPAPFHEALTPQSAAGLEVSRSPTSGDLRRKRTPRPVNTLVSFCGLLAAKRTAELLLLLVASINVISGGRKWMTLSARMLAHPPPHMMQLRERTPRALFTLLSYDSAFAILDVADMFL